MTSGKRTRLDLTEMGALEVALAYRALMSGAQLVVVDPKRSQPLTLDPQVRRRIVEAAGLDQSPASGEVKLLCDTV